MTAAIVAIKEICLAVFEHTAFGRVLQMIPILGANDAFVTDIQNSEASRSNSRCPIIRHIEIQIAIAVHIGQCHRGGAKLSDQPAVRGFGEFAFPIVKKEPRANTDAVDEQVEITIAIHICQNSASGILILTGNTCGSGEILKFPISQVAIERVGPIQPAEINVAQPISIDISQRDTGTVEPNLVFCRLRIGKMVSEIDSGLRRSQQRKANLA